MARKRRAPTAVANASSELGNGHFATNYTSTGRAIRSCRTRVSQPVQDSQDSLEDDDEYDDMSDEIAVAPSRRKKRRARSTASTRDLSSEIDLEDAGLSSDDDRTEHQVQNSVQGPPALAGHLIVNLTVNVPLNQKGPVTLVLDPRNLTSVTNKLTERPHARSNPKSNLTGFLDLPAELKNDIYREVLVGDKQPLRFGSPGSSFGRSSALLRTCKQVYDEGRSILYSENAFIIERRSDRYGSLWKGDWQELGYLSVRKFFKSIGPANTMLIRHLTLRLEDAVPCLNTGLRSNEERRFVNDEELLSVLRHLAQYSQLQSLHLTFYGRRRVDRGDNRFLDYMRRIRADSVDFLDRESSDAWYARESKQEDCVKKSLLAACTRKHKKFDG